MAIVGELKKQTTDFRFINHCRLNLLIWSPYSLWPVIEPYTRVYKKKHKTCYITFYYKMVNKRQK